MKYAKRLLSLFLAFLMLLGAMPVTAAAEAEPIVQTAQTVFELDFSAVGGLGYEISEFTEELDGWTYDAENSHDVVLDFYRYSAKEELAWDYRCLRVRQTVAGGLAVLNFTAPVAGTYKMELTYGRGNNANQTTVEVGGTVTSFYAYAQYGAAPETVVMDGVTLTAGSNPISFSVSGMSQVFIKNIVFTLVEAAETAPEVVTLDFSAAAEQGRAVAAFTEEKDGWCYDASRSENVSPVFFRYNKNNIVWDYSCLRFTQTALGGKGAVRFTVPTAGLYDMTVTYCTGNSGNQTELIVGGTTTSYHAWANWGAAPKTATTPNVLLTEGSNLLTVSCPTASASYMMLKDVTFTLVEAAQGDGKAKVSIASEEGFVMKTENAAGLDLRVEGETALGKPMDLSEADIFFESTDPSVVSVTEDGHATPVAEGCTLVQVTVTLPDGAVHRGDVWVTVTNGKAGSTYYTAKKREAALYNAYNTDWGKSSRIAAVRNANYVLQNLDAYYDMVTMEGLPRAEAAGMSEDPLYQHCPMCNVDLIASYGNYGWQIDPINEPWKIICPACGSRFPSNDFASYYASGLDAQGFFHSENADAKYLVNELYPEKGTGWGVDDGYGWNTGETYTNAGGGNSPRIYAFVAVYNGMGIWSGQNTDRSIDDALNYLRDAYLYTGDVKYGRAGAILIDRVADAYATMNLTDHVYKKPRNKINYLTVSTLPKGTVPYSNNQGTYFQGKIMGCITEANFLAKDFLKAYDAFFPMFDDAEVLSYLSQRAEAQGLTVNGENPKDTPAELRENGINGLVHEISEGVRNRDIWGNFGLAESTLALAAVILDTEEQLSTPVDEPLNMNTGERRKMNTDEMITWLVEVGTHAHNNMLDEIIKSISRDGFGDEVSPQYHLTWLRNFIDFADAMVGYDGYPGMDLYRNPRFVKMLTGALALTAGGNTTLQNGDSGSAGGVRIYLDQNAIARAFRETGRVELAQALYFLNGNKTAGIVGDMFDREAEHMARDVQAIIDEHGPYDVNKSVLLPGYGQALLKYGTDAGQNEGLYGLWFGRLAGGHGNRNALDLSLFAYGLNFAPSFGYPQAANNSVIRTVWERGTVSRNTVLINDQSQKNYAYYEQFPNTEPYHFDDAGYVKVMDVEAVKAYPDLADEYRRTVVMVQGDDDAYYAVDFFRVAGGSTHLYSFHAAAEEYPVSDGVDPVAQAGGTYAGVNVEYGTNVENGYSFLYDVQTDKTPANNFYLDYTITDHRGILPSKLR